MDFPTYSDESESHSMSAAPVEPVPVTLSIWRPQLHTSNPWKEEKENNKGDIKREQISLTKSHWLWIDNQPVLYLQSTLELQVLL